jgi:glycosyltransferase involved in cell wall biosynthesis
MSLPLLTENRSESAQAQPLKVLLSAYACEPHRGSEPGVGWNTAREIARYHQVWVLTSNTHRSVIEAELKQKPIPNLQIVYLDPLGWVYDWSQEGQRSYWDVHLHYYLWQIKAFFVAKGLHQSVQFDIVHHVTYVKYFSPSFLALLPIPFLWGPVGGGESSPKGFSQDLSLRAKVYEMLRNTARRLGEFDPFVHLTARRSQIAWATTNETARSLDRVGAKNVQVFSQLGLNDEEIATLAAWSRESPALTRFISIGRLLHWKGFHLGLQAFAQAELPKEAEYWIVGDGPELQRLQQLAQDLGITHQVKFWHKLSRAETFERLGECLALVHPSLHDSGGLVCLEAMAARCPVLCLDVGGPGIQVTSETGFKIPAQDVNQVIEQMAAAMVKLTHDRPLRDCLGLAAQQRVYEQFRWRAKAEYFTTLYQTIMLQNHFLRS